MTTDKTSTEQEQALKQDPSGDPKNEDQKETTQKPKAASAQQTKAASDQQTKAPSAQQENPDDVIKAKVGTMIEHIVRDLASNIEMSKKIQSLVEDKSPVWLIAGLQGNTCRTLVGPLRFLYASILGKPIQEASHEDEASKKDSDAIEMDDLMALFG